MQHERGLELADTFRDLVHSVRSPRVFFMDGEIVCAPVHDKELFLALLREAEHLVFRQDEPDLQVICDYGTRGLLESPAAVAERARRMIVLVGSGDRDAPHEPGTQYVPCRLPLIDGDRLFLMISSNVSLALFASGEARPEGESAGRRFLGGWTVQRSTVLHMAQALLDAETASTLPVGVVTAQTADRISSTAMRLTALHASALESREQDINAQRDDLLSVLDILKAISSKEKAHDILFVFVEQIARIIEVKRCSIVCVSEGGKMAQVLASHDDANVCDWTLPIDRYPELKLALETGRKVVINDVHRDPLTMEYSAFFRRAGIDALLVLPFVQRDSEFGTLILRAARAERPFSLREISFFEIVAEAAASALEKAHLVDRIQQANRRLEQLAITDPLTGLYNRRYFFERLDQEVARARRYGTPLSCLMLDVDDFKKLNDRWGHLTGDAVLREIARRIQQSIRRVDLPARYGGEEFVILLPQTDLEGARVEAERIRRSVGDTPFPDLPDGENVTVSIGIAALNEAVTSAEELVRLADDALYRAKSEGKNRCVTA
ncbi:MAG TPA: sensor domain-containing diguanylate cyclase [Candidatus Hydrogenedentes bacterium]|nr:sensor domain-containing diguanylate cyclase [Candidatus Hydrogenedentota bacterium]